MLLNQLFFNLLNNALKFSREGIPPEIQVRCKKLPAEEGLSSNQHACFEISIHDNGIGFELQYAEKFFKTFNRLHSQSQYEGTGLGLALCKRIVAYHGGRISAHSNGQGATFTIVLPQKLRQIDDELKLIFDDTMKFCPRVLGVYLINTHFTYNDRMGISLTKTTNSTFCIRPNAREVPEEFHIQAYEVLSVFNTKPSIRTY